MKCHYCGKTIGNLEPFKTIGRIRVCLECLKRNYDFDVKKLKWRKKEGQR